MSHFAVISPPFASHFRALEAVAGELVDRGHQVTFLQQADAATLLRDPRMSFAAVGQRSHPRGSLAALVERAARPGGPLGLRRVIADVASGTDMLCREGADVLRGLGVDAIIADQMEAAGGLLGEHLGLPWFSVACALPVNREPLVPLPVMPWGYADTPFGEQLNRSSCRVYDRLMAPHARIISAQAERLGLPARQALHQCLSPYAQISQTVRSFDFPRLQAPGHFHAVGPLRPPARHEAPLDPAPATDRPLVFASLGTLQGGRFGLFRRIARACRALQVQLLLAHCGRLDSRQERCLLSDGATWVTDFAPQRSALAAADIAITHAGLNTVMDALVAGTPMLALPIAFDQPGVAARVRHTGVGLRMLPALATRASLVGALQQLLDTPGFAERSAALGRQVQQAGGAPRAADLIEAVLRSGKPAEAHHAA